ncbi:MAG TPA: CapA family protein [Tenuifilaceae bacterium]|nr:CapA family protein [Tenuifilaceae bacterium]HPQ33066.1 CapA family protein [Tenuifilaceae bacterium]
MKNTFNIYRFCSLLLLLFFFPFPKISAQQEIDSSLISVVGVGDIMMGTNFPNSSYLPPNNDCEQLFSSEIRGILNSAHITFGNLEGCFLNEGKVEKRCKDTTICYAFKMPDKYVNCLFSNGFDVVSLANNHIGDFGEKGRSNTMRLLDSVGIRYGGLLSHPTSIIEIDTLKIGFCAFAPNTGTCSINDTITAKRIITDLKSQCDIVITSFHGGAEGSSHRHVTRNTEIFYGENRGNVYQFARVAIDAGADIVFGHGPHVTRAIDIYKNRFIAYSLGNFCTYARFNLKGPNGFAPIVRLLVDKSGKFVKGKIYPIKQSGNGGAAIDNQSSAIKEIKSLTSTDIPESNLVIENDGSFYIKEK